MKNIVGGYTLPTVTVYGVGPDNCTTYRIDYNLPVYCDINMARAGSKCRTADCKRKGQCKAIPFYLDQAVCDLSAWSW